jgi:Family of unknown function (DUF5722)
MYRYALCLLLTATALSGEGIPLSPGPHKNLKIASVDEGAVEITIGAGDPHFWTGIVPKGFDPERHRVLEMEYFAPSGMEAATVRFRVANGEMVIAGTKALPMSEAWQPWSLDLSQVPDKPAAAHPEMRFHIALRGKEGAVMRMRNLRVREPNSEELRLREGREKAAAHKLADAQRILETMRGEWPAALEMVRVGPAEITLAGRAMGAVRVIGLPPETASHLAVAAGGVEVVPDEGGGFRITVPRIDTESGRDRALWRWRLAANDTWISAAKWYTEVDPAQVVDVPRMKGAHPKGLGGIPNIQSADHPLFELGISHATVNVVISSLIRDTPAPDHEPWTHEGRTYFINQQMVRANDATLGQLQGKGIIVSAILLVGNHRHADGTPHTEMTHPEAEIRGIYAMPNLADEQGARLYGAALRFLASRYHGGAGSPGRISNWIMHNEIDQAGTWTNMGDQPIARYLEAYMRSARLTHHTARLFDRHARVFISLTHHWTKQSSGTGTYVVRDLLELFAEMARAEGDFEWGVAYHPYPRDLRNPDTWNDAYVTGGFDTPYITPRNIEVLPAFLKQGRFLFQGQPRGILLSEQGFNTPTLSVEDQRRQVAGFVYMFRKLEGLPEIEAYHLHRYQDMPDQEGGLRLGILTETGERKLGWDAYREIGTGSEKEREFRRVAEEVWGRPFP